MHRWQIITNYFGRSASKTIDTIRANAAVNEFDCVLIGRKMLCLYTSIGVNYCLIDSVIKLLFCPSARKL